MKHYRNYHCYITKTKGLCISNTVEFFPAHVTMPTTSSEDGLTEATQDLIAILQKPHPATLLLDHGDKTHSSIKKLETIFIPPQ